MLETGLFCVFGFIMLNLASAGVMALLTVKVPAISHRRRTLWTVGASGALTALMFVGFAIRDGAGDAWASAGALAMICAAAAILSLPGAIWMRRTLPAGFRLGDTFA